MKNSIRFIFCLCTLWAAVTANAVCRQNSGIYYFSFGDINATVLYDGPIIFPQNPFLVPTGDVESSYDACFRETSPFSLSLNVVVLDTPHGRWIVDPGSRGSQSVPFLAEAGQLFKNLKAAMIPPGSIDAVLLTHAHADHVNALITSDGKRAFPKAKVYISRIEHEFWTTDPLDIPEDHPQRDTLFIFADTYRRSIAPYKSKLKLLSGKKSPLQGVRFIPTPGHSAGHNAIEVTSKGTKLIISGDTWFSKPDQVENPEWSIGTDIDGSRAAASRKTLLQRTASDRDLVLAFHEQFPGLGYISKVGALFSWIPAPPKLIGAGVRQRCAT